jgi:hypothetical protein
MSDKSDYNLPRTKLHELLPSALDSDVNTAVFENIFNRFLTKNETRKTAGYVGEGNPNALTSRQIHEPTVARQANQLQPVLYNKIGSIDHMASWQDILNELERLGVEIDKLPDWGKTTIFNWVPPIDIDKVVNYLDYYWVDDNNNVPEYITIKNRCRVLEDRLNAYLHMIALNKATYPVVGIDTAPTGSTFTYNRLIIEGDYTSVFEEGFEFRYNDNVVNVELSGLDHVVNSSVFNATTNQTTITINTGFDTSSAGGTISLNEGASKRTQEYLDQCATPKGPLGKEPTVTGVNQWIVANKWQHRTTVTNFSTAKQAKIPIIEYDDNLELNEWTTAEHEWKYRASPANLFAVHTKPTLIELVALNYTATTVAGITTVTLSETAGNQTDVFVTGSIFENQTNEIIEVASSHYTQTAADQPFKTVITLTNTIVASTGQLNPVITSAGDAWAGYNQHWVYSKQLTSRALPHPTANPFVDFPLTGTGTDTTRHYQYQGSPYAMTFIMTGNGIRVPATTEPGTDLRFSETPQSGWELPQTERALLGSDNIRVYVDGKRTYGNYIERDHVYAYGGTNTDFVAGITISESLSAGQVVRVEMGPASFSDVGLEWFDVRTTENDVVYAAAPASGTTRVSLVEHRKVEQDKTAPNQYPEFDVFNNNGSPTYEANSLIEFATDSDSVIDPNVSLRLVTNTARTEFSLKQLLLGASDEILAYKSYDNSDAQYWVDHNANQVWFWNRFGWTLTGFQGTSYGPATISPIPPTSPFMDMVWYDTTNRTLMYYSGVDWLEMPQVLYSSSNPHLQTIWRKGLNDEQFIPKKVDWKGRTLSEYNTERDEFIESYTPTTSALSAWYSSQLNELSLDGTWVGDWDIPDPLYYNTQHENRATLTLTELNEHFGTIKSSQDREPGIGGSAASKFHTIRSEDVNYGLGGTIHEYGMSFDTLLSSAFVNNVTPITLFEFARDQYEILLNALRENFRGELPSLMLNTDVGNVTDFSNTISTLVLDQFTQNDANSNLYGDSSTFIDTTNTGNDVGMQNWIATLPFFNILPRVQPVYLTDDVRGVNQIIHHDGHRKDYNLTEATKDAIARRVIQSVDSRSGAAAPYNQLGRLSSTSPSDTIADFLLDFNDSITNRRGVYWYQVVGGTRILYRLAVAAVGTSQPPATLPDGVLWIDTTTGSQTLRQKSGFTWPVVAGLTVGDGRLHNGTNPSETSTSTVSAWEVFDIDEFLADLVLEVEKRLYSAAPESFVPVFDFNLLQQTPSDLDRYHTLQEQAFLDYARQSEIPAPLENISYAATDAFTWNYKHSAPGQSHNIVGTSSVTNTVTLAGEVSSDFASLPKEVFIKNTGTTDGTFTAISVVEYNGQTVVTISEPVNDSLSGILYSALLPKVSGNTGAESAGDWRSLYQQYYGTPYPHLEPWKLQQYSDKPIWWDAEYKDTTGTRRWTNAMWVEIQAGRIPATRTLPDGITISSTPTNGQTTQYNYFSVNTATDTLLPPYFAGGSGVNRSVFTNLGEITSPAANYSFGDNGPNETNWRLSSQYLYDQLDVAYQMQPLKVIDAMFGFDKIEVAGLPVDTRTNQVPAHNRTKFHGDIADDNSIVRALGFNQWYVNYNRYQGFDASLADFRRMWTDWTAPLTYQFATFVDTGSFQLGHRTVPISEFDYKILSKRSPGVEDFWLNAFDVKVLTVPPKITRMNNEDDWRLELDINTPLTQSIDYYDVRNYPFSVDLNTNVCELYQYTITNVNYFNSTISVQSKQTTTFSAGRVITITGSTGNDGTYTVHSSVYDGTTNTTIVSLGETLDSPITSGSVSAEYRVIPWETGDPIYFTTSDVLPTPLISDQPNIGPIVYYIIVLSDTEFQVANTRANALAGLEVGLSSIGRGTQHVSELQSTFYALDQEYTSAYWRHYALDTSNKLTITPPTTIHGMQELVNIIDGYSVVVKEAGFSINEKNSITDPDSGRVVDWQIEIERFIDFAYSLQGRRDQNINNRFEVTADSTTNSWTWGNYSPNWTTGTEVNVLSSNGRLPIPILHGVRYYVIIDSTTTFRLAHTKLDATRGIALDLEDTPSGATLMVYQSTTKTTNYPSQEINPFRDAIFFNQPRGIVSNMTTGPSEDIRNTQLLFDQYGEPLDRAHTRIYRQDEQTFIQCARNIKNPNVPNILFTNPYNFLHFGGAHIFIDAYEHVLVFNSETTEGALLYDPFIGLNVTKFELLFNRQVEFTERPNVGGSYYSTYFNQGASLLDNFEASVENIRYLYDAYQAVESKALTVQSRTSLGYEGQQEYLADLNLNQKSQFIFWRGLIQNKGAVESVQAFINSRRFIDANIDEFWAYKVADFGSANDKEYPELYITTEDIRSNDFRIQFTETGEVIPGFGNGGFSDIGAGYDITGEEIELEDDGITPISLTDTDRWFDQPDIVNTLRDNGSALYFAMHVVASSDITGIIDVQYRHNFNTDYEIVTLETEPVGTILVYTEMVGNATEVTLPGTNKYLTFTGHIQVIKNGAIMNNPTDYEQVASPGSSSYFSTKIAFTSPLKIGDTVQIVYNKATLQPEMHFDRVNSNIIRFKDAQLIDPSHIMKLWGYRVNDKAQNPGKLVDRLSGTIVTDMPLWDPARGIHYKLAESIISLRAPSDPAVYTETLQSQSLVGTSFTPWNSTEVGHVWMDTSKLGYVPYHDDRVFQTLDERLKYWGLLADWSEITLYEWVESDLPPDEYNDAALNEEGDSEIAEHIRKSGKARETVFELHDNGEWAVVDDRHQEFSVLFDASPVSGTTATYEFTLDATILDIDTAIDADTQYVSVYVNGIARISPTGEGFEIPSTLIMEVEGVSGPDMVRFIKRMPSDSIVDQRIVDGTMERRYEHTIVPYVDKFGQIQNRYYFWVGDKVTRNLKQPMSITSAQSQLTTIPTPYIVVGNPEQADIRASALTDLDKSWQYMIGAGEGDATSSYYQISGQTQDDFAVWNGGEHDPLQAYVVGDIITLGNNMEVLVEAVDAVNGDVTEFSVLVTDGATSTGAGPQLQTSLTKIDPGSTTGAGFYVILATENINNTTHGITLGSAIKNKGVSTTLLPVSHVSPNGPYDNKYIPGSGSVGLTSTYTVGDSITLNNNAVIVVDSVDANGDVVNFTVAGVGDSFNPGDELVEVFSTPAATNSGFTLFPDTSDVVSVIDPSLFTVSIDGRTLIPYVEYTIDSTGRVVTLLQSVGAIEGRVVDVSFTTVVAEEIYEIPARMTDIVLRGLRRYVNEDRRYTVRFTRDFTLRDDVDVTLKSKHTEWQLIRQDQATKIPLTLWNRVTEAMTGYKLTDPSEAVPELTRVLYDEQYGTDTRYGLGDGQAFTNGAQAIETFMLELFNEDEPLNNIDLNTFFEQYSFDTPENVELAMTAVYNTFVTEDVNRLFFVILHDAFANKKRFAELFKTSMIAVHGIRPFQTEGLFDD